MIAMTGATLAAAVCSATLDHQLRPLASAEPVSLCEQYSGNVILVVNTASRCGFTPQLEGLETLHQTYSGEGLVVMGFPSNDFNQELEAEKDIEGFCRLNYGVTFPMFEKTHVTGPKAHPFFAGLASATGTPPQWNFHKYLIDRDGNVVAAYPSRVRPDDAELVTRVESLLRAPQPQQSVRTGEELGSRILENNNM
jgi:glutathione peroxidase